MKISERLWAFLPIVFFIIILSFILNHEKVKEEFKNAEMQKLEELVK